MSGPEMPTWGDKRLRYGMPGLRYDTPLPSYITNPPNLNHPKGTQHMASNRLPDNLADLKTLGRSATDGADQLGATIGLKQNTEDLIKADTDAFSDACDFYNTADTAVKGATTILHVAVFSARAFMTTGRDLLKTVLGNAASTAWAETGFSSHSLAVPNSDDLLQPMVDKMRGYLTNNPARENAPANFTAANALALFTAIKGARSGLNGFNVKEDARISAMAARDLTETALRRRLNGLVGELTQLLDPMSPHWITFGLSRPGAQNAPDPVKTLTATPLGGARVKTDYSNAARTAHYQICQITDPATGAYVILADSTVTTCLLENQPVGTTIRLQVRGVNDTGTGKFSPAIDIAVT